MTDLSGLIEELLPLLGPEGVLTGDAVGNRAAGIWRDDRIAAPVIFRPGNTEQVAAVMRACSARGQSVVTHGGLTGLAEGAIAGPEDAVLSTERLRRIEAVDPVNRVMRVQAGVQLSVAQQAASDCGLLLALDLGARGSCTLGGNAATNAGGNNVLRYGMAREQILGLEVVLADGTVMSSMNTMLKNNAGYDLRQWFVGSEGTLGIITRLVMRLRPLPVSRETALLACSDMGQVANLLSTLDAGLAGKLTAFELMWRDYYRLAAAGNPPLTDSYPYYVLVEASGNDLSADQELFVALLQSALEQNCAAEVLVCKSESERDAIWQLRESVELTLEGGNAIIFDVSLPLSCMETYVMDVERLLRDAWQDSFDLWVFGHAGDGNLHLVVAAGEVNPSDRQRIERCVYEPLQAVNGSVSAEHGIGLEKKPWLHLCRNETEVAVMRRIKQALDPHNILNPGRIFDLDVPA